MDIFRLSQISGKLSKKNLPNHTICICLFSVNRPFILGYTFNVESWTNQILDQKNSIDVIMLVFTYDFRQMSIPLRILSHILVTHALKLFYHITVTNQGGWGKHVHMLHLRAS